MSNPPFFSHTLPLRWRDMDSYRHVNNSEYLTLCEEARVAWFLSLTGPWRTEIAEPLVARIEMDYKKALLHPAHVWVHLSLHRLGNSSLTLLHTLGVVGDDTPYAIGKTVLVWTNPMTGSTTSVPDLFRQSVLGLVKP
jgi:acyl-CoA thioester hydrolase